MNWNPLVCPHPKESTRYPGIGPAYLALVPLLVSLGKQNGYAISFHGSLGRDMDCIAVPWTDEAKSAKELIAAITEEFGLYEGKRFQQPEAKSHGRLAWSLYFNEKQAEFGHGPYLDISVMPCLSQEQSRQVDGWSEAWDEPFKKDFA